ncbi:MAG: ABC transporter ATP-binding protein [Tractidigestivibacter sp.]|uniref:ABC transporter ATP-binding protein n=1 Tax=Tractidigestivibacter sp. TaxID=2847320 RepID=UPI003D919899
MSDSPIIEMRDVSFTYTGGDSPALSHVSLSLRQGSFVGIIGPSGAGKSTLAAALSGAIPHHFGGTLYGATIVDGNDTCEVSLTDISQVVGSVLQDIDTQMVSSVVEDEMLYGLENFGVPRDQIEGRLSGALATVGISELRNREIATLSGGQKQKVAIAAILALKPRVLVLDEPTAALDPASSKLVFETLRTVRQEGVTVVVIEQKVALLSEYCDRVLVMDKGRIAFDGTPHEVFLHGAELRKMGVDSPRVARVSNSLAQKGVIPTGSRPCLSVTEAHDLIAKLLRDAGSEASDQARNDPAPAASHRNVSAGQKPALKLEDVSFSYSGTGKGVRDVTMSVYPGELVGIIGQNGAGKTTLTKLLNGLLKPEKGTVTVAGMDTRKVPVSQVARHVSTLFQNPDRQLCKNTVLEEVAFGPELHGTPQGKAEELARAAIQRFGLPENEAPFSLSRGQRQMVALASVVVMHPDVVILDEPTSGLDYRECMTVMETVRKMAEQGCAVVMVCHDMEVVSDFAQRIVVMADGQILARGEKDALFADADLMARASVEAPQVVRLSQALAADVSPAFSGISQVSGIVDTVQEMVRRG